jgi:trk system potassium uptake protein
LLIAHFNCAKKARNYTIIQNTYSNLKIVIIGSGDVGIDLSTMLSREKHDVVVLDTDRAALAHSTENSDILAIEGSGTSAVDLIKAGVQKADLVIAATNIDEVNMMASLMSKRLGARKVIARIRNEEFLIPGAPIVPSDMGIDIVINPELSVAYEIVQLVKRSAASDVVDLAGGQIQVIGIRLHKESPINGLTIEEYAQQNENINFRVVAILRGGITIIPNGSDRLRGNDHIFAIALNNDIKQIIRSTGISEQHISNIMIAGGSLIGRKVAKLLLDARPDWNIKLIEPDYDISYKIASDNKKILVLNGDPTDPRLLASEGIMDTDVFIAVTDDEESNIISCLMAKHLKVRKVIAMVSKSDYIPLSQTIGLDSSVNKKLSAANEIHRHVRGKNLMNTAALNGIEAEILEMKLSSSSPFINKPLSKIKLPAGCVIGGIISSGKASIGIGSSVISDGDSVLVFCRSNVIDEVTDKFN